MRRVGKLIKMENKRGQRRRGGREGAGEAGIGDEQQGMWNVAVGGKAGSWTDPRFFSCVPREHTSFQPCSLHWAHCRKEDGGKPCSHLANPAAVVKTGIWLVIPGEGQKDSELGSYLIRFGIPKAHSDSSDEGKLKGVIF